jgi:hypothetical protein
MRHRVGRPVIAAALVLMVGATLLAQRGGFRTYNGNPQYDGKFQFVRMSYAFFGRQQAPWAHDYSRGEENFLKIFNAVTNAPMHVTESSVMAFDDPEIFKNPVIYLVEPGYWEMTPEQAKNFHDYIVKGGFLIVDDFPQWAWSQFDMQISKSFPDLQWQSIDITHPIFHSFFELESLDLPIVYPQLGGKPIFRALFENNDPTKRMYAIANYQNDISEYWEGSPLTSFKPVAEDNEAFKFGINEFIYGITH